MFKRQITSIEVMRGCLGHSMNAPGVLYNFKAPAWISPSLPPEVTVGDNQNAAAVLS